MAFASDSTTAPAVQAYLLPLDRRAIGRDGWARARDLAARLGGEVRAHLAAGMRQAWAAARGLLQAESTASAPSDASALASESAPQSTGLDRPAQSRSVDQVGKSDVVPSYLDAIGAAPPLLPLPAPLPSLTAALARRRAIFGSVVPSVVPSAAPPPIAVPDPAFAAVRAFDAAVFEWDGAFAEYVGIMDALDPDGCGDWNDPQAVAREALGPLAGSTVAALDGLLGRLGPAGDRLFEAEDEILATRAATEIGAAALRAAVRRYARRPFGCPGDEDVMLAKLAA